MIPVTFTLTPGGMIADLEVGGVPFEGYAAVAYAEEPSDLSEGGPHLVVELMIDRFTPDPRGLVLWIGDECYRVDLGTRRAPSGGTAAGAGSRKTCLLPVMVVVGTGERQFAGRLVSPESDPTTGWDE